MSLTVYVLLFADLSDQCDSVDRKKILRICKSLDVAKKMIIELAYDHYTHLPTRGVTAEQMRSEITESFEEPISPYKPNDYFHDAEFAYGEFCIVSTELFE